MMLPFQTLPPIVRYDRPNDRAHKDAGGTVSLVVLRYLWRKVLGWYRTRYRYQNRSKKWICGVMAKAFQLSDDHHCFGDVADKKFEEATCVRALIMS